MENERQVAATKEGRGLLRRLLRRRRHEDPETDGDSRATEKSALDLADIQGFILRGYRMPMVRHFLLTVGDSGTRAQATRTARQRRRIRCPANHHRRGLARGVRARTGRQSRGGPTSQARLLPQHRYHVVRTGGAGDTRTRSNAVLQVIWRVHRRSGAASGVGRRYRSKRAPELDVAVLVKGRITSW